MADDKMSLAGAVPLSAGAPVPEQVPILPLRDTVLFPQSALPLGPAVSRRCGCSKTWFGEAA